MFYIFKIICYNIAKLLDPKIIKLRLEKVRLVDENGAQVGVYELAEAEKIATEKNFDLILVTENSDPPVAKLGDFRKFLYQLEKEKKHQKKHRVELKEIRISFVEGEGDMERKAKHGVEFLEDGNPVKIRLSLRGRQKLHIDFAKDKLEKFLAMIEMPYKFIQEIKKEPNFLSVTIAKK
ncbi:MAG: translation initiation factor IF-3 [Patescibacteria group bacterium]